eukprot:Nk52_evm1s186 gene=Nk52_evmTU1s186
MSVVGFDIGNRNCYIAIARQGGIEVIANEYSYRATPASVSFTQKQRFMGESAKQQEVMNVKNTITQFKSLLGRSFSDPDMKGELARHAFRTIELPNGDIGVNVTLKGEEQTFSMEQIMGMLLVQLKSSAEVELKAKVVDCVIAVPNFWNEKQRRALMDAAQVAGLNCLRLVNEITAAALAYGIYKTDLPESKPRNVVFVDVGQSSYKCSAVSFVKGKLNVLSSAFDDKIGGRNFDEELFEHFRGHFLKTKKLDVLENKKAAKRLLNEAEKMKNLMSANSGDLPVNIECLMEDTDFKCQINRGEFEEMCSHLIARVENPLRKMFKESGIEKEDLYSVEIIGGASRIPCIKAIVERVFGLELSTTLNADEAVARGACLQAAIVSPNFRVRDFSVTDICPYGVELRYKDSKGEDNISEVFSSGSSIPCTKALTFMRTEPFDIDVSYVNPEGVPGGEKHLSKFSFKEISPDKNGDARKLKIKVRMSPSGIFSVENAHVIEELSKDEPEPMEVDSKEGDVKQEGEKREEGKEDKKDEKKEDAEKKEDTKPKKVPVKRIDIPVEASCLGRDAKEMMLLVEAEVSMAQADRNERERADALNALEEYVYEMRGELDMKYVDFVSEEAKSQFGSELDKTEEWIYDEGEEQPKKVYVERLKGLRKVGDAIVRRYNEFQERPKAEEILRKSIILYRKVVEMYKNGDEKYAHIPEADMQRMELECNTKEEWLNQESFKQSKLNQCDDPCLLCSSIYGQKEAMENICRPIVQTPKPKPPSPKKEEAPAEPVEKPADANADPKEETMTDAEKPEAAEKTSTEPKDEMDVD